MRDTVDTVEYAKYAKSENQTYQTNPNKTKSNLPNQTYQTKPNLANHIHQTKPKLLVKAVDAWVCSAFGNVFHSLLWPWQKTIEDSNKLKIFQDEDDINSPKAYLQVRYLCKRQHASRNQIS